MKRLVLDIEDEAFARIEQALYVRRLSAELGGTVDAVVSIIVDAINDGLETRTIRVRKGTDG